MVYQLARTPEEARVYIALHPCECGKVGEPQDSAVIEVDGDLARRYARTCSTCGAYREFTFRLPATADLAPSGNVFGDGTPSELLDPGEWLWVADRYARAAPADTTALDESGLRGARRSVAAAEAAVCEVLAFVPAGADAVPAEAFRSERGRAVYEAERARFARGRLEVVRDTYREILGEIDASLSAGEAPRAR